MHRPFALILATFGAMLCLGGCALPDLDPFADATAELHKAVVATDINVRKTLNAAGAGDSVMEFQEQLAVRVTAMQAVVEYTDALAAIAAAGSQGRESAEQLGGALNGFLGTFSTPAFPAYMALATSLYGAIANVRAARSLETAVSGADVAVQGIGSILVKDFTDLENLLQRALVPAELALLEPNTDLVDYRVELDRRRRELEKQLAADLTNQTLTDELTRVNELVAMTEPRYTSWQGDVEALRREINGYTALTRHTRDGIVQWMKIHSELATTLQQGLPLNTRLLAATAAEIQTLIEENDE